MKKNWISIVLLILNVVLLVSVISLGGKLERTEENLRGWIGRVESEVQESAGTVIKRVEHMLEDSAKQIVDFTVEPAGIDSERQMLLADVVLTLRQWTADTAVELHAFAGEEWAYTLLTRENNICRGRIEIPLQSSASLQLTASVTTDGLTTREELGSWWDIAAMLPVQLSSWGGSTPHYKDGTIQLRNFDASFFDGQEQYGIAVQEPEFRLYVNDALVSADAAAEVADGFPEHYVRYEYKAEPVVVCQPGDTIRLNFVCKDDFGLGYEFVIGIWRVPEGEGVLEEVPAETENRPTLTWD